MEPRKLTREDVNTLIQEERWETLFEGLQHFSEFLWEKRRFFTSEKLGEGRQFLGLISVFQRIYYGCKDEAVFMRLWQKLTIEQKAQALQELKHLPRHFPKNKNLPFFDRKSGTAAPASPAEVELITEQMALGKRLIDSQDYEGALICLSTIEEIFNDGYSHSDYCYYYGLAAYHTKQWMIAASYLSHGGDYDTRIEAQYLCGIANAEIARTESSISHLQTAVSHFNEVIRIISERDRISERDLQTLSKANLQAGKLSLDNGRRYGKRYSSARVDVGHAISYLDNAIQNDPTNWEAYYHLAEAKKLKQDFKAAYALYKKMPAENEWTTMAVVGLLQEIHHEGRHEKLSNQDLFELIMKLMPQDRANYLTLFSTAKNTLGHRIVPHAERRGFLRKESEEGRLLRAAREELARLSTLGIVGVIPFLVTKRITEEITADAPGGAEGGAAPKDEDGFVEVALCSPQTGVALLADAAVRKGPGAING